MIDEEIKTNEIYKMEIHSPLDLYTIYGEVRVLRVPGGWIYHYKKQSVFVPWDNEFMNE